MAQGRARGLARFGPLPGPFPATKKARLAAGP